MDIEGALLTSPDAACIELAALMTSNERRPVSVRIGMPTRTAEHEWACRLDIDGLHTGLSPVAGGDGLQALCLAMMLAATLLRQFVAEGGRLEYASGGEFPLESYFGWLGDFTTQDAR